MGTKNKLASLELRSTSVAKGYGFLLRQANKFERASHARESRKSTSGAFPCVGVRDVGYIEVTVSLKNGAKLRKNN